MDLRSPTVILDDARPGRERLVGFVRPREVIAAHASADVPWAFARIEAARTQGFHVAGYFSYELGYLLEPRLVPLLPQARAVPLLWFGVFEDREIHEGADARAALERDVSGRAYAGPLTHQWDDGAYGAHFRCVHDFIGQGDIYQANLSFRSRFAFLGDALSLYLSLREASRAAHGAFIADGERHILSLSPELFFNLAADGTLTARPMKGTAARHPDPALDIAARTALAASEKDRAENLMIVDLLRNDLGRIAEVGSVGVRDLFAIETYPTVHQMVSTVTATLKPGASVEAIVRALFPCGSVTGAPKIRAMEITRALEQSPRGIYCGAIGHFAPDGSARFNVAIRTLTIADGRGELGIGGAIVQDSTAVSEYAECLLKARYYEITRKPVELIETLRFAPGEGFTRLHRHLDRMACSTNAFGIAFNKSSAVSVLKNAEVVTSARVRLVLKEYGALSVTIAPLEKSLPVWTYAISPLRIASNDALLRHKTGWRELYESEQERLSRELGCDEVIFLNERGEVAEGSRSNVFIRRYGQLLTPPLDAGLLDGCLRRELIEQDKCIESTLTRADLARADKVYLGNSLRGLIRAVPAQAVAYATAD